MDRFILGQTGGTTGEGTWTAYRDDEFREAFVDPFVAAADHLGFPGGEPWLFIGPSGPHIIGKVVRHLANMMVSADPFSVDFDPRWVRKLAPGSFARHRYLQHVIDQAMAVIDNQPVGVLFTTPPVLEALAAAMSPAQRQRIRAVHYGGVAMSPEALSRFQNELFPAAIHLSGYGNTLTGCCLELNAGVPRQLDYFPHGHRLILEVVDESGEPIAPAAAARRGRVRVTRLDESMLIVRMVERDVAEPIAPPADAPEGFRLAGVRNPCPHASEAAATTVGLY
jgi:hypothetical protein